MPGQSLACRKGSGTAQPVVVEAGGQEEHREQTDGYTASPVITRINGVNHRLSSCSPCGRGGSDTVIEN